MVHVSSYRRRKHIANRRNSNHRRDEQHKRPLAAGCRRTVGSTFYGEDGQRWSVRDRCRFLLQGSLRNR